MILAYITCSGPEEARDIGRALIRAKLAACANSFPITSWYMWQDKMKDDNETVLLVKSVEERFDDIKDKVIAMHSYKLPCIMRLDVEANRQYEEWVRDRVK